MSYILYIAIKRKNGYWILDAGCWILDAGYWMLDAGYWILDAGCWMLDTGYWILDGRYVNQDEIIFIKIPETISNFFGFNADSIITKKAW